MSPSIGPEIAPTRLEDRVMTFLVMVLMGALVLWPNAVPLSIALVAVTVVLMRLRSADRSWVRPLDAPTLMLLALFYGWHLVGMAWSSNMTYGLFDLEVKASLLVFPVFFWVWPKQHRIDIDRVLALFCWVNVLAVALCSAVAVWRFASELHLRGQGLLPADPAYTNHFFESRFSLFLHPGYMAMYLCMALGLWVLTGAWRSHGRSTNAAVIGALLLGVMLCNSKMGWITAVLVIVQAIMALHKEPVLRRPLVIMAAVGALAFGGLLIAFPTVSGKITQAFEATGAIDPTSDQSSQLRRMVWKSALSVIAEAPTLGVGTGDVKDALQARFTAFGYVVPAAKHMNAHGQFLQSAAALGAIGGALALGVVVSLLLSGRRDGLAMLLGLLTLLNWSVESMAEVQAGVVFLGSMAWLITLRKLGDPSRTSPHDPIQPAPHR